MKKLILLICIGFYLGLNIRFSSAQETSSESLLLYNLSFVITSDIRAELRSKTWERSKVTFGTMDDFPRELVDSILILTQNSLVSKFQKNIQLMMPLDGKGVRPSSLHLEGLPANAYKKAVESGDFSGYLDVSFHVGPGGKSTIRLGGGNRSRSKPKIQLSIIQYGKNKEVISSYKNTIDELGDIRKTPFNRVLKGITYPVLEPEALMPEDIYAIFLLTIDSFENK